MTRSEVTKALEVLGEASTGEISDYLKQPYILHVLNRMYKWREVTRRIDNKKLGGGTYIWKLVE